MIAAKSELPLPDAEDPAVIVIGMLTINPALSPLAFELVLGVCTISISASAWDPLYVCNDGA